MIRRDMIKAGIVLAGAGVAGCARAAKPAASPYEMPLESAPHARTLMQWPVSVGVYGARDLAALQAVIVGRDIVQLNIDPLGASGGGIHCATQQQPR